MPEPNEQENRGVSHLDGPQPLGLQRLPLSKMIEQLPATLEYTGEFGAELICFLPTVYWLHRAGHLSGRKIKTYEGMRSFYFFLPPGQFVTKRHQRVSLPPARRPPYLANRLEHTAIPHPAALFPDFRRHFMTNYEIAFDKPLCVIQNKYCVEWGIGPINHLPVDYLDSAFSRLKTNFQIVYFRQGLRATPRGFSADHNTVLPFDDHAVLARHPEVLAFEDLLERYPAWDYNTLKNIVFSRTHFFLASQGGGNYHCSLFSGSLLSIHHRQGQETQFSYAEGFYRFASDPAPLLLICGSRQQLEASIDVFLNARAVAGRLLVSPAVSNVIAELKPPSVPDIQSRLAELERISSPPANWARMAASGSRRRIANLFRLIRRPG